MAALGGMGRPGMAAYLSLVTNEDARVRVFAIEQRLIFARTLPLDLELAGQFRKSEEDPDYQVRVAATNALKLVVFPRGKPTD